MKSGSFLFRVRIIFGIGLALCDAVFGIIVEICRKIKYNEINLNSFRYQH